jgi:hypothetical protein
MPLPKELVRVNRKTRCPVCEHYDWCLLARDGSYAVCCRADGDGKCTFSPKLNGWKHQLDRQIGESMRTRIARFPAEPETPPLDCGYWATEFDMAMTEAKMYDLAESLGIDEYGLSALNAGWSVAHNAFTFPMRDDELRVIGFRLRNTQGKKWAVRGSHNGLFVSEDFAPEGPVYICEGPTDTAAMLGLGLDAIGRSSCRGEVPELCRLMRRVKRDAVIVADADGPGVDGAYDLANKLIGCSITVRIIQPLVGKDVREWIGRYNATADLIGAVRTNSMPVREIIKEAEARMAGANTQGATR